VAAPKAKRGREYNNDVGIDITIHESDDLVLVISDGGLLRSLSEEADYSLEMAGKHSMRSRDLPFSTSNSD
jgi:hypothetical protein